MLLACVLATMISTNDSDSFLQLYAETRRFSAGRPAALKLTPDGSAVLFLRSGPKDAIQTLFETDLRTGKTRELLTPATLLAGAEQSLSVEERARLERQRISARGFTSYQLSQDGRLIALTLSGKLYVFDRTTGKTRALEHAVGVIDPKFSPDASRIAYVRGNDLYVSELATGAEQRLTTGGNERRSFGLAEFVAQEELDRFTGFWWSPDSARLLVEEVDTTQVQRFTIADPLHPERPPEVFPYPRAGTANAQTSLSIVSLSGGAPVRVAWDSTKHPYLARAVWSSNAPLCISVMNRQQTELELLAVDPSSGAVHPLVTERDEAWLNISPTSTRTLVPNDFPLWRKDGAAFFWFTERDGGPELELRARDGKRIRSWVKPEHGLEAVAGFDERVKTLYFTGSPNPTEAALYRVVDGAAPEKIPLFDSSGDVQAALAKDSSVLVAAVAFRGRSPRIGAFDAHGKLLAEIPSVAIEPPFHPNNVIARVGAGDGIWSAVLRPRDFVAGKKLPVIVSVYGGPHFQSVRQAVSPIDQWLADQGFIVAMFDGRGTPRRGRAWERALRGDFGGVNLDDQVAGLHALAAQIPEMDLSRVGVTGWSFGGYLSALAVMKRPDVFKAAVAGAPVVDWNDYDTCYTERYLGVPQQHPEAYRVSSLLTHAPKLERPLLVLHGTADDNVYFFHSLKLADALFRAGRPHRLMPLANLTHMVPDPIVTLRLNQEIVRFFRDNL